MKKEQIKIKGTGILCKGAKVDSFNRVPDDIFHYAELGLISGNDLMLWIKLLQYHNDKYGYAYPTVKQLKKLTGLGEKTVENGTARLHRVGLLRKAKRKGQRNIIYFVDLPLSREQLYEQVPHLSEKFNRQEEEIIEVIE